MTQVWSPRPAGSAWQECVRIRRTSPVMDVSWPSYLAALAVLVLQTGPVVASATYLVRVLLPPERPMLRLAAGILAVLLQMLLALEIVGVVGWMSRWPLLVAAWLAAGLVWLAARILGGKARARGGSVEVAATTLEPADAVVSGEDGAPEPEAEESRTARYVWYGTVVVLVFAAVTALVSALVKPSFATDTMTYHLTAIAGWVREHTIWSMRQWQFSVFQNGYPMNSELTASWFVVPFGRDYLVNLAPLAHAGFALAAMAALAEQLGLKTRDALLVGATGLFVPIVATAGIGSLGSDLLPMGGWVLSVAFVLRWRDSENPIDLILGGLALGLALGSKITGTIYGLIFAGSFLALVLWRRRWAQGLLLLPLAVAAPAVVWYARNFVLESNPVWAFEFLDFRAGYWRDNGDDWSVWQYMVRGGPEAVVRVVLDYVAGLFFVAPLLVFGFPGLLRTLRAGGRHFDLCRVWLLTAMPVLALAVTWAMPWTSGNDGYNVPASGRYVVGTFAILLATAMSGALKGKRPDVWRVSLLVAFAAGMAVSYLSPLLSTFRMATRGLAAGFVVTCCVAVALFVRDRRGRTGTGPSRRTLLVGSATLLGALLLIAIASAPEWNANWYRNSYVEGLGRLYREVQDRPIEDSRFAVAGLVQNYPLHGPGLTNEVMWLGRDDIGSPWRDDERAAWLDDLRSACIDYLVVYDDPEHWLSPVQEMAFVSSDTSGLEEILVERTGIGHEKQHLGLYGVEGLPARCGSS